MLQKNDLEILSDESSKVSELWKSNSVLLYADKNKLILALEYLKYAKLCEPFVAYSDKWEEPKKTRL